MHIAKAHAYGNDFLFVPADDVEGAPLDQLTRRLCERYTGVGGDGVIYYSVRPDGTARMRLINADGSPSELSGNGLRCLAALVLHQRGPDSRAADHAARGHRRRVEDLDAVRTRRREVHVSRRDGRAHSTSRRRPSTSPASRCPWSS